MSFISTATPHSNILGGIKTICPGGTNCPYSVHNVESLIHGQLSMTQIPEATV